MWLLPYHIFWSLIAGLFLPFTFRKKRFRKRWALELPKGLPNRCIWIHALSVGEVLSAIPLINAISKTYSTDIVFTVTTEKGMEIAKNKIKDKVKVLDFFPFDFWWSVTRFVRYIRPLFFILIETDIWPFLLSYLSSNGIKSFLVNGRISPRTYLRYSKFPWLVKKIFDCFELCMVQSEQDRIRLLKMGLSKDKVINVGNIKFDKEIESIGDREKTRWRELFDIGPDDMVWIAGSTHPGEEEIILNVLKRLKERSKRLVLLIAPRDIKRSLEIHNMAKDMGFSVDLRSKLPNKRKRDIVIIDTIGELSRLYGIADMAFVGGSLVPFGGHNLIEPASLGCPVIFGPYTFNFRDIADALIKNNGGKLIKGEDELYQTILELTEDPIIREKMGDSASSFIQVNKGATDRVISLIMSKIKC